jgi:hypothetical protein
MHMNMRRPKIYAVICFLICFWSGTSAVAETVSLFLPGNSLEHTLIEAAMKRLLRAEGYTVKGGTTDGYLLIISIIPNESRSGQRYGVTGHVVVASLSWQKSRGYACE